VTEADPAQPAVLASVDLPPAWLAAVLLLGRTIAEPRGLACESVAAIVQATGTSKSRAYEIAGELAAALPALVRTPGRPTKEQPAATSDEGAQVTRAVLAYVMQHPGCVDRGAERQRYGDGFRRFVVELRAKLGALGLDAFAEAAGVPPGTLKDWLRAPQSDSGGPAEDAPEPTPEPTPSVETLHMQTVLDAWTRWSGSFLDFCKHVQRDLRVPFGRDLVRRILATHGQRKPARRDGRSPDEIALRGAFRTWFPGAQWVGDGMQVPVVIDGQRFVFNVELDVDAYAGAFVGASVRDTEDSDAVVEAFQRGAMTTGALPLALLLDNKPSNHTPEVDAALGDTLRIRATPERPQNKAHVEGAFGLFSQVLPPLVMNTTQERHDLARGFLGLVIDVWARATNHRPRKDRAGRSRVDLYADAPTTEQLEQARRELREIAERQERARRTLEARRRPELLALLDGYFTRLGLLDPERHIRVAIAGYPKDAIVDGLTLFEAKRLANTLPDGADARYLLGIVKNVAAKTEGEIFAELLYRNRIEARDRFLAPLRAEREALRSEPDVMRVLLVCVEKATDTPSNLERTFWLDAIVETLRDQSDGERQRLYLHAARLIQATYAIPARERHDAVRYVADRLVPLT
jgi:hypothetical protein